MQTKAKFEESRNKENTSAEYFAFNILEFLGYQCGIGVSMMEYNIEKNKTIDEKKRKIHHYKPNKANSSNKIEEDSKESLEDLETMIDQEEKEVEELEEELTQFQNRKNFHQIKISQLVSEKFTKNIKKQVIKALKENSVSSRTFLLYMRIALDQFMAQKDREGSCVFYKHLQAVSKQGLKCLSIEGNKKKEKIFKRARNYILQFLALELKASNAALTILNFFNCLEKIVPTEIFLFRNPVLLGLTLPNHQICLSEDLFEPKEEEEVAIISVAFILLCELCYKKEVFQRICPSDKTPEPIKTFRNQMEPENCIEYVIFGKYGFNPNVFSNRPDLCKKLFALQNLTEEKFQGIIKSYEAECDQRFNSQKPPKSYCGNDKRFWQDRHPITPFK